MKKGKRYVRDGNEREIECVRACKRETERDREVERDVHKS